MTLTPEETGAVIGAMTRNQMIPALASLSVRHPEVFAECIAWSMEADARTARYLARKEAEVLAC